MLPQQTNMVKENRIDTRAHLFAASCAIAPGACYLNGTTAFERFFGIGITVRLWHAEPDSNRRNRDSVFQNKWPITS
jgi:hypothetical protein